MTVLTRGARPRRGGRRPGWVLLTVLLVLAIAASSALVFTNRVELLKLAVILSLWAAVAAAFVSVIYRRQSDIDQAKARDLKLVYDLQLDREISARREYELTLETQLRRELASELQAQQSDEVAALRSELAALRTNLEILFDTDLAHRPALETERTTVRAYSDWARDPEPAGRLGAGRFDAADHDDEEDSAIIDVAAEPQPPESEWAPDVGAASAWAPEPPRQPPEPPQPQPTADQAAPPRRRRRRYAEEEPAGRDAEQAAPESRSPQEPVGRRSARAGWPTDPQPSWRPPPTPQPQPQSSAEAEVQFPWLPPQSQPPEQQRPPRPAQPAAPPPAGDATGWRPAPAEGQWIPPGAPGSNWVAPVAADGVEQAPETAEPRPPEPAPAPAPEPVAGPIPEPTPEPTPEHPAEPEPESTAGPGRTEEYVGRRRAPEPAAERPRARHYAPSEETDTGRDATFAPAPSAGAMFGPTPPPTPEPEPTPAPAPPISEPTPAAPEPGTEPPAPRSRRRSAEDPESGQHTGGQSVAELMARLQANGTFSGRRSQRSRRNRDDDDIAPRHGE
ncbi:DUF6779 domain-containing protein [Mycolicibacterium thermoresistibile]